LRTRNGALCLIERACSLVDLGIGQIADHALALVSAFDGRDHDLRIRPT